MALSYDRENLGKVVDNTEDLLLVPNEWGLFNQLGIFENEYKTQSTLRVPRKEWSRNLIVDRNWGERNSNNQGQTKSELTFSIPHFPLDDYITPDDVDGKVAFDDDLDDVTIETVERVKARKMQQLREDHAYTLEAARAELIDKGKVYAPNKTLATSYGDTIDVFVEFGVTQKVVATGLDTTSEDPLANFEPIIAHIQDETKNGVIYSNILVVCSPEFFTKLITHPYVKSTYDSYARKQGEAVLSGRLTADKFGLDARYRAFDYAGMTFVEYRGTRIDGVPFITPGEARAFPLTTGGRNIFKTYFAPAKRFGSVNTAAKDAYWFEYFDERASQIEIMTESNFANICLYPQAIVKVTTDPV